MNPTTFKIGKKLNLIQLLMEKRKIPIEKLLEISGYDSVTRLKNDLGQLFMFGISPYSPGDFIEVEYDGNFVSLSVPVSLDKKVRLNVREWMEINEILSIDQNDKEFHANKKVITSILKKIRKIFPLSSFKTYAQNTDLIEEAISQEKKISFQYTTRKGKSDTRLVDPLLVYHNSTDYLIAWSPEQNANRMYRIEAIRNLKITNSSFRKNSAANESIKSLLDFIKKPSQTAELVVTESAYYNFSQKLESRIIQKKMVLESSPAIKVETRIIEEEWFLDAVSRFGKSVVILKPEHLRSRMIAMLDSFQKPAPL